MKLSEILIAYRNKVNELKQKYAEDLKANDFSKLVKDPEYKKYMSEFANLCKFSFDKMTLGQEDKAKEVFGSNRIKYTDLKGNPIEVNVSTPTNYVAFQNIDKYCDAILSNSEVASMLTEEIAKGKHYKDLSLVGLNSKYNSITDITNAKIEELTNKKAEQLKEISNISNFNGAFNFTANKCSEYQKSYKATNSHFDKAQGIKYAGILLDLTKYASEKINFDALIDKEIKEKNYIISDDDLKGLKSLEHKSIIAKHRGLINGILSKEDVSKLFSDFDLEDDRFKTLKNEVIGIKAQIDFNYNKELDQIKSNYNEQIKLIDQEIFEEVNEDFDENRGVDKEIVDKNYNFIDDLEKVSETTTVNNEKRDYANFMKQKGIVDDANKDDIQLSDEKLTNDIEITEEPSWGDNVVSEHETNVTNLLNEGINLNNSDTLINEIASIKAKHNARPWYQKFFGYFGRIGNELNEADRIAEIVANRLGVDSKLIKEAVDETAKITSKDPDAKSKKYILKEELLKKDSNVNIDSNVKENKNVALKLFEDEPIEKEEVKEKELTEEEKKISEDFIKGVDELSNEDGINVLDSEIEEIDKNYDFSLGYEKDKEFIFYDKMQTEEYKENDKEHRYATIRGVNFKLEEAYKLGFEDNFFSLKETIDRNKEFDKIHENITKNVGDYKEKKEIEITDKFDFDVQRDVGEEIKPVDQESLIKSLNIDLDEGNPPKSQKQENIDAPNKDLNKD